MEDLMYVYVRCAKNSTLLEFDAKAIEFIKYTHPDFEKKCLTY